MLLIMSTNKSNNKKTMNPVSTAAVKKLAMKGGIKSMGAPAVVYGKQFIHDVTTEMIKDCIIKTVAAGRKVVPVEIAMMCIPFKIIGDSMPKKTCKTTKAKSIMKKIQYYQSNPGCAMIPVGSFKKMLAAHTKGKLKMSCDARCALQYAVEKLAVIMFAKANKIAAHAGRTTVKQKNMKLVKKLNKMNK